MEYFFQSMFNAVLYGWTLEAFPAPIRGTACGLASFWGRLFGIVSPLIAQHLYGRGEGKDINSVLYLAGGVTLGCMITTALLPGRFLEDKVYKGFPLRGSTLCDLCLRLSDTHVKTMHPIHFLMTAMPY